MAWWLALIITLLVLSGILTLAWGNAGAKLFIVNTLSRDLAVFDIAADRSLGAIPLNEHGYRVAFSPDGQMAYVTASSEVMLSRQAPRAELADATQPVGLLIIDLREGRVIDQIALPISPLANVHIAPDGRWAYVVTAGPPGLRNAVRGRVLVVDLPQRSLLKTINIGLNPLDSVIAPNGATLFSADWGSRSISVVDLHEGRLLDTIPLGLFAARMLAMPPTGKTLYTVLETPDAALHSGQGQMSQNNMYTQAFSPNSAGATLAEIDIDTRKMTLLPIDVPGAITAIAVSPDGARLYTYGTVPVGQQMKRQQELQQAQQSAQIRQEAYALSVIDLEQQAIINSFPAEGYLSALAVSPDGRKIYLIGAPGDPAREAATQRNVSTQIQNNNRTRLDGTADATQRADDTVAAILQDLSQLPKTLIVLDADTGERLTTLPLGSLPQGHGITGP